MTKSRTNSSQLVNAYFQALVFAASLIVLSVFLTLSYREFKNLDPVYPLEDNKINASKPTVTVGLHITQFSKFFMSQNIFEMIGTIWFAYDPTTISLDAIKKFSIDNGVLIHVSEPNLIQTASNTIARFRIQVRFHSSLYYLLFPMDDHCLNIVVTNDFLPTSLIFAPSANNVTIDPSLDLSGWRIIKTEARTGYSHFLPASGNKLESTTHQKTVFSLYLEHNNPMLTINIVLTLLLLLFIAILTFSSDQDCVLIVTVGMVALIGYRFVLQSFEPLYINYFTLADYMYLFALIGTIATLFFGIFTRERNSSLLVKKLIIMGIYAFFVGGCSLLSLIL